MPGPGVSSAAAPRHGGPAETCPRPARSRGHCSLLQALSRRLRGLICCSCCLGCCMCCRLPWARSARPVVSAARLTAQAASRPAKRQPAGPSPATACHWLPCRGRPGLVCTQLVCHAPPPPHCCSCSAAAANVFVSALRRKLHNSQHQWLHAYCSMPRRSNPHTLQQVCARVHVPERHNAPGTSSSWCPGGSPPPAASGCPSPSERAPS